MGIVLEVNKCHAVLDMPLTQGEFQAVFCSKNKDTSIILLLSAKMVCPLVASKL